MSPTSSLYCFCADMGVLPREITNSGLQRRPVAGTEAEALPRDAAAEPQRIPQALGGELAPKAFPLEEPPFTLKDLRQAVPKACFKASYATSAAYIAGDLVKTLLLWLALNLWDRAADSLSLPAFLSWAFYAVWSFYLGAVWFGVFVIGHECGHNATFPSRTVNDIVGFLLHTPLLVPYHAWRVSHGKHHNNTCSMENDEVFIPPTRSAIPDVQDTPLQSVITIATYMTVGWCVSRAGGGTTRNGCPPPQFSGPYFALRPSPHQAVVPSRERDRPRQEPAARLPRVPL